MSRLSVSRSIPKLLALSLGLVLFTSCQPAGSIWIMPGSNVDRLVFGISETRNGQELVRIDEIHVYRCSDIYDRGSEGHYPSTRQAVWAASARINEGPLTNQILYGETQSGLESSEPQPLAKGGCYVVRAYADDSHGHARGASVGFNVAQDGTISEMPADEYDKLFSPQS